MPGEINIDDVLKRRASINIDPEETPAERSARLQNEDRQARFEMVKNYVVFFAVLIGIVLVGSLCTYEAVFNAVASAETKRWAQTTLSALFTGSVSFVLGQMTAKKPR
jgi:hypothetical protein